MVLTPGRKTDSLVLVRANGGRGNVREKPLSIVLIVRDRNVVVKTNRGCNAIDKGMTGRHIWRMFFRGFLSIGITHLLRSSAFRSKKRCEAHFEWISSRRT